PCDGDRPSFDRITVRAIENTAALEANLLSGDIDMIDGELGLSLDQALAFERRHGDRYTVLYKPGLTYEHIDVNLDNPILADLRVRQALLLGIDRPAAAPVGAGGGAKGWLRRAGRRPGGGARGLARVWSQATGGPPCGGEAGKGPPACAQPGRMPGAVGFRQNAQGQPVRLSFMTTAG